MKKKSGLSPHENLLFVSHLFWEKKVLVGCPTHVDGKERWASSLVQWGWSRSEVGDGWLFAEFHGTLVD